MWVTTGGVQATPEGLGGRLAAAKPVAWKGRGELLQLPWPTPCSGLVLVVDLWSGLAGLLVALLALGVRFVAITAEMDNRLGAATAASLPNIVHARRVEDVHGGIFKEVLARRRFDTILVGGDRPAREIPP